MAEKKYDIEHIWIAILFSAIGSVFIIAMIALLINDDNVDIDTLGEYMCDQHNKTVVSSEIIKNDAGGFEGIKVICRQKQYVPIDDGYLFLDKGLEVIDDEQI